MIEKVMKIVIMKNQVNKYQIGGKAARGLLMFFITVNGVVAVRLVLLLVFFTHIANWTLKGKDII